MKTQLKGKPYKSAKYPASSFAVHVTCGATWLRVVPARAHMASGFVEAEVRAVAIIGCAVVAAAL